MTIYDISKQAGVSIATVSRVLNCSANVRPKTKKKVLDIIEASGYTPNAFARGLGLDTMNTIGILCADSSDLYIAKAIYHIERYLRFCGYNSLLCCTGYDLQDKKASLSLLLTRRVDSVIMVGSNFIEDNDEDNQYIRDAAGQIPVMLLNADYDFKNVYCTLCDDFKSVQDATLALLDSGIEDILFLYNSHSYSGKKKLTGYQAAFLQRDLPVNKQYQQFFDGSHEDIEGVCALLSRIHDEGLAFHGIMAADDMLAAGAVKYARLHNYRIPEDLSVIGFNNSILTTCCEPELTSIDNQLEKLCSQLTKTLMGTLNGEDMPAKTIFSGTMIKRATTRF